ncbi:MAG: exo-alpha-sialidase [Verrucomicrobiota bacterium]|nr:exo-alpha-sialidase [Verrucomicrobiota bacterium]
MSELNSKVKNVLIRLAEALVDQDNAKVLVEPQRNADGFWFGSGNIIEVNPDCYLLCGRYRNHGDSRTGTGSGARGLEFAIFKGASPLGPFSKIRSFSKEDLSRPEVPVVSIEGGKLFLGPKGLEMIVSTEKAIEYPKELLNYQKPGTGVWSIDRIMGETIEELDSSTLEEIQSSSDGATLHIKDPVVFKSPNNETALVYCNHPFTWSSSNTGLAICSQGSDVFELYAQTILERGTTWDVACTRITDRLPVPRVGCLVDLPALSLYFYDGAECLRVLDENAKAINRPRGFSCEEIGGLAWGWDSEFPKIQRLSVDFPLFVSPNGTGCSRYVSTLVTREGIMSSWQQSQADLSQPLVGNFLNSEYYEEILEI